MRRVLGDLSMCLIAACGIFAGIALLRNADLSVGSEAGIRAALLTLYWGGAVAVSWSFARWSIGEYRRGRMRGVRLWGEVAFYVVCVTAMGVPLVSATWRLWLQVHAL